MELENGILERYIRYYSNSAVASVQMPEFVDALRDYLSHLPTDAFARGSALLDLYDEIGRRTNYRKNDHEWLDAGSRVRSNLIGVIAPRPPPVTGVNRQQVANPDNEEGSGSGDASKRPRELQAAAGSRGSTGSTENRRVVVFDPNAPQTSTSTLSSRIAEVGSPRQAGPAYCDGEAGPLPASDPTSSQKDEKKTEAEILATTMFVAIRDADPFMAVTLVAAVVQNADNKLQIKITANWPPGELTHVLPQVIQDLGENYIEKFDSPVRETDQTYQIAGNTNSNHAEMCMERLVSEQGSTLIHMYVTRPVCRGCVDVYARNGDPNLGKISSVCGNPKKERVHVGQVVGFYRWQAFNYGGTSYYKYVPNVEI